jgi:hypothetical protein
VVLGGGFARTFADANGYYEVQGIPRGAYFGIVRCAGYRTASMTDSAFGSLQLTNAVNRVDRLLRFKGRGPVVRGIVVGPAGEPLAHSAVSIVADAVKGVAPLSAAALARPAEGEVLRTGADGVFQLVGVPYGECRIRVECGGQVRTNVVHVAGDQQTVFPWTPPSSDPPFAEWLARFFPRDPPADPSVAGPNADPDHDGASNTNEFLCGTDPTNGARSLRMGSLSRKGSGELAVRWASAEGCFYRLLRSTNLKTGFVEELASDVAATPPQNTFEDTAPPSNAPCFYRVDLDPER